MESNNTWKWVLGGVVVAIIALGIWWFANSTPVPTPAPTDSTVATTTEETSGAGKVQVQTSAQNVATVVAGISNGTRFASLLASTGVGASLSGKGPYTVFVSTDGAFSRVAPGTISSMSAAQLKRLVQYHIIAGKKLDVDAVNSGQVQALSKDMLNFQVDATKGAVYVNSGYVLKAYAASNGIVYVINSVLLPPKTTL